MGSLKQLSKYTILILLVLLQSITAIAENFSYVYIQGDKQTPFYVKFEGEMLPRYGKNYTIISQLTPGPIHVQILFQQNVYPAQNFTIQVPENGYRGFLLSKQGDEFTLYDIQQQFYLSSGDENNDHLPNSTVTSAPIAATTNTDVEVNADTNLLGQPLSAPKKTVPEPQPIAKAEEPVKENIPVKKETGGPAFMDMELTHEHTVQADAPQKLSDEDFKGKVAIVNSDCPHALDNDLFDAIVKKANDKSETARLKYLLDKTNNNCFTTNQIRTLTRLLTNDPERYTFLKKAYSRVTDQSAFPALESLLSSREWKDYFKLILP